MVTFIATGTNFSFILSAGDALDRFAVFALADVRLACKIVQMKTHVAACTDLSIVLSAFDACGGSTG
jgi:hypothetical protein